MTANIIGAALFIVAISVLYLAPALVLRHDRRFMRMLRKPDPNSFKLWGRAPRKVGAGHPTSHSRCAGVGLPELSPGTDSYGRVTAPAEHDTARLSATGGGSNHPTEGTG